MARTTLEEVSEDYPYLTLKEREDYARYLQMLEGWNEVDWNEGKGFPLIDDPPPPPPPPSDPPKWRGEAEIYFNNHPRYCNKKPGYGIDDRVTDIALGFTFSDGRDESDESDVEDEDEETVEWLKGLLDELQAYDIESTDVATLLHSIGCLIPFLGGVLSNKHACIRAKAAELITSMVQNRPTSQQLVIQANGLQLLLNNFTADPDTTSRTKALGAISSLIRNNKSGITVFLRENGYEALRNAASGSSTHNDEVVDLIGYLRRESSLLLYGDDDSDVQEARNSGQQLGKNDDKPKQDNSKKRRNYSSLKRRLKPFNKLHLPPFQKKRKKQFKLEKNEAPLNLGFGPLSPPPARPLKSISLPKYYFNSLSV